MEVASGLRQKLPVFGNDYDTIDGTGVRDYIHVNDLAAAHLLALDYLIENPDNLRINLATGEGYSVMQVIEKAREITGQSIEYDLVDRRPGDPSELYATSLIAAEKLHWKPRYSDLNTILKSMWEIYK